MAERIKLHPDTPHVKRIFEIADKVRQKSVLLFPTDSRYALGCDYTNKKGIERVRAIRNLDKDDHLTLLCHSLSGIDTFAHISDRNFKLIKRLIPGPYTLILPARKEVPRLLVHPRKKTVGIRVPDYPICEELIKEVGRPLLAITAKKFQANKETTPASDRESFLRAFEKLVDVIIDNQQELPMQETTVIDMTGEEVKIVRRGLGFSKAEDIFRMQGKPFVEV